MRNVVLDSRYQEHYNDVIKHTYAWHKARQLIKYEGKSPREAVELCYPSLQKEEKDKYIKSLYYLYDM